MSVLKLFIFSIFILFPFGELLRFEIGNNITIRPLDMMILLSALWFVVLKFFNKKQTIKSKLLKPIVCFFLVGLISLAINSIWLQTNELFASSLYLIRWISYAAIIFIILQFDTKFKKKIIALLFIDGLVILLAGYIQYFFYPSLKELYYLGWDEHMHRMFSVFFDPNFAGAFFVVYFLFVAGLLYQQIQEKKKNESIVLSIVLFFTLVALLLTFSRAALLALVVGSGIFLILINKKKLILIILAAIGIFALSFSSQFYIENINLFREASSKARLDNYAMAMKIIQDRPLLGVGFNSYRYAKESYRINSEWTNAPSHADAGVDNSFLFILATTGIFGLGAFLWIWEIILKSAYTKYKQSKNIFSLIILASFAGLGINAFFINSLFFPTLMLWIWIIVGLVEEKKIK